MVPLTTVEIQKYWRNRTDRWWLRPFIQGGILVAFGIYAMWAVLLDVDHITVKNTHYLSPFFSPEVEVSWWPEGWSPGLILIWAPLGFRATCYYARKVYFRAFLADPPGCAIGEFRKLDGKYKGETSWPWILNNLHRYFFYLAFILSIIHWYDFILAMKFTVAGKTEWGMGIGTIIIGLDALFLSLYVLSCHSCKHLIGGGIDCHSCKKGNEARYKSWKIIKKLNEKHHAYFWISLFMVVAADLYIRLLSRGLIDLVRLF